MNGSLLSLLGVPPPQVSRLPGKSRTRLLNFLMRWEAYEETVACLEELPVDRFVSLQDLQARAFSRLGQYADALVVMQKRLAKKNVSTAQLLYGRLLLEGGNAKEAYAVATRLTEMVNSPVGAWSLLGDLFLQQGEVERAVDAYTMQQRQAPHSRAAMLGLAWVNQKKGDGVAAAAYAVRAFTGGREAAGGYAAVPVPQLQELLELFDALGDQNRVRACNEQLKERFAAELSEIQTLLARGAAESSSNRRRKGTGGRREAMPVRADTTPLAGLAKIPISAAERRALEKAAKKLFGFFALLPAQAEIMACARRGENVLAILPTGAGKSLCYQLLAFMDESAGVTLVVSPLIALMKDQIDGLPATLQKQAIAINSSMSAKELRDAIDGIATGHYKLIYAAPERLRQEPFLHLLRQRGMARFVVDEAHCVSVWGHDFRPDFLHVAQAHRDLGAPPILALTATAPPVVRQDIQHQLFSANAGRKQANSVQTNSRRTEPLPTRIIATDTYRPNLNLSAVLVRNEDEKLSQVVALCKSLAKDGSGIIYARTRRRCEELADLLRRQGFQAEHYHAGVSDRAQIQDRFMRNDVQIIVATIAFGMGVDKPDIRFILHYGLPDSVESYYQEAGRAGRDGNLSRCLLLHSNGDKSLLTRYANEGIISADFLRAVYKAVRAALTERNPNTVSIERLVGQIRVGNRAGNRGGDNTQVQVALSMLEELGLLQRHYDVPNSVSLALQKPANGVEFKRFAGLIGLQKDVPLSTTYLALAERGETSPVDLERQLLAWQSAGLIRYAPTGRSVLLTLLPAARDVSRRVESLLDRYATIQQQRVTEIVDFARTRYCRHGHLANYLGGEPRSDCGACDCCAEGVSASAPESMPSVAAQLQTILTALDEGGWGRRNLMRLLRGDPEVNQRGQNSSVYGALGFRSETSLEQLIDQLHHQGYIREQALSHGGVALGITQAGRRILTDERALERIAN